MLFHTAAAAAFHNSFSFLYPHYTDTRKGNPIGRSSAPSANSNKSARKRQSQPTPGQRNQ
eukprot:scaffold7179_cov72-Cyclotella_meneghiniana.AAC.11